MIPDRSTDIVVTQPDHSRVAVVDDAEMDLTAAFRDWLNSPYLYFADYLISRGIVPTRFRGRSINGR